MWIRIPVSNMDPDPLSRWTRPKSRIRIHNAGPVTLVLAVQDLPYKTTLYFILSKFIIIIMFIVAKTNRCLTFLNFLQEIT